MTIVFITRVYVSCFSALVKCFVILTCAFGGISKMSFTAPQSY